MRRSRLVLALSFVLGLAPAACKGSSSSSGGPAGGTPSTADVRWPDGGGPELVVAERTIPLPAGELPDHVHPAIMQDETGKRLAYVKSSDATRLLYLVGGGAYLGAVTKGHIDFNAAPDLDHALGALFENAGDRRAQLVADVAKEKGDAGIARMLTDGAHVDAKEWNEAFAKLPEARAAEVKTSLAMLLEKGKPTAGLRHAVAIVPLREPARAPVLAARVRELADPIREPRATAVLLRALAATEKQQAAQLACEVLGHKPLDTANAKGTPEEIDLPGREALVEAAALAVAAAGSECPHVAALLGEDPCMPYFRCGDGGPLSGREATKQDEVLCTKEQLTRAIAAELDRTPADVLSLGSGTRPQLFAFASLTASAKLPPAFVVAHTRRRYAVVQPKEPLCDNGVAVGTPCHCEEAVIRDQACRHPEGTSVQVGLCKFEIDDKQKKLFNVVASLPP